MASYVLDAPEPLLEACGQFAALVDWADGDASAGLTHAEVEAEITERVREVARLAYQGHLDLRADREPRLAEVADGDGIVRDRAEYGRCRQLTTVVGEVVVERIAYRRHGHRDLLPGDGQLNLPAEHHSHGLRRLAAVEATRGSFANATAAIERATGQTVGKRQVEALTVRAAVDIDAFYAAHLPDPVDAGLALGMNADAKGDRHAPRGIGAATANSAPSRKLATRLSAGEKRGLLARLGNFTERHHRPVSVWSSAAPSVAVGPGRRGRHGRRGRGGRRRRGGRSGQPSGFQNTSHPLASFGRRFEAVEAKAR